MIGITYSVVSYQEFKETGNANLFEVVIDKLMLEKYSDDEELTDYINSLPKDDKRIAILSLLDNDNNLWNNLKSLIKGNDVSKFDHIKDVVLMLREFVKIAEVEKKKFGEVMTPLELVKEMLATLPEDVWSNPDLKWLDPANGTGPFPIVIIYKLMKGLESWEPDQEKRYKHIVENMIYTCELQPKNVFLWLCAVDPKDEYVTNTYWGSFLEEGFDKHMKDVWCVDKFDIVIGNPPYNQTIDLKFLEKSYSISDQILFVHPSTWLIDEKNKQKKFIKAKKLVGDSLVSVKMFNGNGVFGISLFVPCAITYINKYHIGKIKLFDEINKVEVEYDDIFDINKYNSDEYLSLKKKVIIDENLWKYKYKEGIFYVNLSQIRGHVNLKDDKMLKDDFYTIITKDEKTSINKYKHLYYGFDSKDESHNFINYLKTKFSRFCLSIYKNNSQLCRGELVSVPWLDFTQEWTDEKLREKFNITDKEWEFIDSVIPDYY